MTADVTIEVKVSGRLFIRLVQYPIIVEAWHRREFGRGKRRYAAEFTVEERATLEAWQSKFRAWYLREGTPEQVTLPVAADLEILQRGVQFFATV